MNSKLLAEVALAFADREHLGTQLSRALKSLCTGLHLSRAYLYIDGPNRTAIGYTHEWCAEGVAQQWMQDIPYSSYAFLKQSLMADGQIVAAEIKALPDDLRFLLEPHGILSLQAYPIEFDQQIVGFVGFDDCRRQRFWTDDESSVMKSASAIISALCEREIMREHLRIGNIVSDEDLEGLSIHDPLTGTYNRRYVFDRLEGFDAEYARLGRNFCITLLDIDQLDAINDSYGRAAGDYILKELASLIATSIRPYDLSGRYGEDEFIIVSVNASALETGYLMDRLKTIIKNHAFNFQGTEFRPAFSYGIADSSEFAPENLSIEIMVQLAAQRMQAEMEAELAEVAGHASEI